MDANNRLAIVKATAANIKAGVEEYRPIVPLKQHEAVFYGLAKAAGDSTQSSSSNAIGTYTADAKSAIQSMLGISTMIGATSSVAGSGGLVPAPATTDVDKFLAGDGTYKSGGLPMVILSYGNSTWTEFENAYNNNVIVYCRASSNSNPASGSQTRMAFMAYVNNATTPTEVEFQYYRSMSSHSATAMGDQVFVYKLTKTGGWSVTTRDASIKQIKTDTGTALGVSWSSNVVTLTNTMTANEMPMSSSDATTAKAAIDALNSKFTFQSFTNTSHPTIEANTFANVVVADVSKTGYTPKGIIDFYISGLNIFDKTVNAIDGYISGDKIISWDVTKTVYCRCLPNTTYTVSKAVTERFSIGYTTDIPAVGSTVFGIVNNNAASSLTITTGADAEYLVIFCYHANYDTESFGTVLNSLQVETGNSASGYVAYNDTGVCSVSQVHITSSNAVIRVTNPGNRITIGDIGIVVMYVKN